MAPMRSSQGARLKKTHQRTMATAQTERPFDGPHEALNTGDHGFDGESGEEQQDDGDDAGPEAERSRRRFRDRFRHFACAHTLFSFARSLNDPNPDRQ